MLDRAVSHVSLSERLTRQVMELIQSETLAPGDRLPSVKDLSERFSVATPTMREALRLLQMAGTIDIRHGSGVYVRHAGPRLMLNNPYAGSLSSDGIMSLLQARLLIEPPITELAAVNATAEHLGGLAELLADAERHLSGGQEDDTVLGVINMRFHRGIAEGAGNSVLADVVFSLTEVHIKEQMAVLDLYNNRLEDHEQHTRILSALQARDAVLARRLMSDHITEVVAVIRAKLSGGIPEGSLVAGDFQPELKPAARKRMAK